MIGAISIPLMTLFTTLNYWPLGEPLCMFWLVNDFSAGSISIYSLLLMAIHRYRQIKYPIQATEDMTKLRIAVIVLTWILIYAFWSFSVFVVADRSFTSESCFLTNNFEYVMIANLLGYVLPIVAVLIMNGVLLCKLRKKSAVMEDLQRSSMSVSSKKSKAIEAVTSSPSHDSYNTFFQNEAAFYDSKIFKDWPKGSKAQKLGLTSQEKEHRALVCLVMITIVLVSLFAVFCVTWPLTALCPGCVPGSIFEIGYWNSYIYSSINPIILLVYHDKFRAQFVVFIKKVFFFCDT
jgi:5-hydroxytryptamine receptor 1